MSEVTQFQKATFILMGISSLIGWNAGNLKLIEFNSFKLVSLFYKKISLKKNPSKKKNNSLKKSIK